MGTRLIRGVFPQHHAGSHRPHVGQRIDRHGWLTLSVAGLAPSVPSMIGFDVPPFPQPPFSSASVALWNRALRVSRVASGVSVLLLHVL